MEQLKEITQSFFMGVLGGVAFVIISNLIKRYRS